MRKLGFGGCWDRRLGLRERLLDVEPTWLFGLRRGEERLVEHRLGKRRMKKMRKSERCVCLDNGCWGDIGGCGCGLWCLKWIREEVECLPCEREMEIQY